MWGILRVCSGDQRSSIGLPPPHPLASHLFRRAALPLCQLIEERSRALVQRPPSNMHLHALSAMGLALMKGARLGQPPSPALDAAHRPAAEAAALARQQRRERPLSSAETLQLMSAVAATLAACAARLPAALRESIEMHERMLKIIPAVERAESAMHGRSALQTSLLVSCCAADMLLRDMDIHAEAPHVKQLRQRTLTPQAVAEFLSAALEGVVQPRTGGWAALVRWRSQQVEEAMGACVAADGMACWPSRLRLFLLSPPTRAHRESLRVLAPQ